MGYVPPRTAPCGAHQIHSVTQEAPSDRNGCTHQEVIAGENQRLSPARIPTDEHPAIACHTICLQRAFLTYAHRLLTANLGSSRTASSQSGAFELLAPVELFVVEKILDRHQADPRQIGSSAHHRRSVGISRYPRSVVVLPLVSLIGADSPVTGGVIVHRRI